jgi:hypothetical protein
VPGLARGSQTFCRVVWPGSGSWYTNFQPLPKEEQISIDFASFEVFDRTFAQKLPGEITVTHLKQFLKARDVMHHQFSYI